MSATYRLGGFYVKRSRSCLADGIGDRRVAISPLDDFSEALRRQAGRGDADAGARGQRSSRQGRPIRYLLPLRVSSGLSLPVRHTWRSPVVRQLAWDARESVAPARIRTMAPQCVVSEPQAAARLPSWWAAGDPGRSAFVTVCRILALAEPVRVHRPCAGFPRGTSWDIATP